jgi:N-acylneuraminate cytidylyltransferase
MKGHSARVPRKNLRPLGGRPLFHWIVETLTAARRIDPVVVETDSDEIAEAAQQAFPHIVLLRRPDHLVGDEVAMNRLIEFHMSQLTGGHFLQTHATNPLLTPETVDRAVAAYEAGLAVGNDSLFSVNVWQTRFFWADGKPVNHDPDELLPTQQLPPLFEENSNLYLFSRDSFAKRSHRIGIDPVMLPMEQTEAIDIDTESSFRMAEVLVAMLLPHSADSSA